MAYDKHIWQCGEAITTEKLNHMEDGIAEGGGGAEILYITSTRSPTEDEVTAYEKIGGLPECSGDYLVDVYNLTYQDAKDACLANKLFGVKLPAEVEGTITSPTNASVSITEDSSEGIYSMRVNYITAGPGTVTPTTIRLFATSPSDHLLSAPYCTGF